MYPNDSKYTKDHEWVRGEGDEYVVGITQYAAEQLGDVTFVELPPLESTFSQGDEMAAVESVKAASEVYAPVSGRVCEVNEDLEAAPELVNQSPHGEGWFLKLDHVKRSELDALMDADAYEAYIASLD